MKRAHPFQAAIPPAHGFGPWECANCFFEHFGDDFCSGAALLGDLGKQDVPFWRFALFKVVTC